MTYELSNEKTPSAQQDSGLWDNLSVLVYILSHHGLTFLRYTEESCITQYVHMAHLSVNYWS
jgi:hypothetical protein